MSLGRPHILTACGKTRFETLELAELAVLLVTKPVGSHRLTPCRSDVLDVVGISSAAQRQVW